METGAYCGGREIRVKGKNNYCFIKYKQTPIITLLSRQSITPEDSCDSKKLCLNSIGRLAKITGRIITSALVHIKL